MTDDAELSNDSQPLAALRETAVLGAGASDLLRAFFWLRGYLGVLGVGLMLLSPIVGDGATLRGKAVFALAVVAVDTWAAFRARRLLVDGDRDGTWMAAAMFGGDFLAALASGHPGIGAVMSATGLPVSRRAWRGMQASDALRAAGSPLCWYDRHDPVFKD